MVTRDLPQIIDIVRRYVDLLRQQQITVERVILYGSYAKGTARPYSDIDLVIISQDLKQWPLLERLQMLSRATLHLREPLEVLGYTPEEIAQHGKDSILWEEISATGKEVFCKAA